MLFNNSLLSLISAHTERRQEGSQPELFMPIGQLGVPAKGCVHKHTSAQNNEIVLQHCCNHVSSGLRLYNTQIPMNVNNPSRDWEPGVWCYLHCPTLSPLCPCISVAKPLSSLSPQASWALPPACSGQSWGWNAPGLSSRVTLFCVLSIILWP